LVFGVLIPTMEIHAGTFSPLLSLFRVSTDIIQEVPMKKLLFTAMAIGCLLAAGVQAQEKAPTPAKWVNIHVVETQDKTTVDVRVPLSLVAVVLDSIKTEEIHDGRIKIEIKDKEIDLKKIWAELRKVDNTDFVKVSSDKENVLVSRQGDLFVVKVTDPNVDTPKVLIKIPVRIVDKVLSAEGDEIDLKLLVAELGTFSGNLVEVHEEGNDVRIWID
jgi:hypothetical protein